MFETKCLINSLEYERRKYCGFACRPSPNKGKILGPLCQNHKDKISNGLKKAYASGKIIPWNIGKKYHCHSPEWKSVLSQKLKENNPMTQQKIKQKARNSLIEGYQSGRLKPTWKKGEVPKPFIGGNTNPEWIKKRLKGLLKRPTCLEKEMIGIIEKYDLPFDYVGDGQLFIGCKNPDFVHRNKKIIIEVAASWCHPKNYKHERTEYFAKYGWKSIIFLVDKKLNITEVLRECLTNE